MIKRVAISLFSSSGLGELGIEGCGVKLLVANELLSDRCDLYRENFQETIMLQGDIWELRDEIVECTSKVTGDDGLFLVYATPPCQGMSTNGAGKLQAEVDRGNRPEEDARNRLVIPAMDVICALRPQWVLFENVPGMKDTVIRTDDGHKKILDYISERLGEDYIGRGEVLSCSDYGIPQLRKRLITVFTRHQAGRNYFAANGGTFFPPEDRSEPPTIRHAIGSFPELDAVEGREARTDFHPLHYVNCMKPEKYWWVENTPEGDTAYNNQCVNPDCMCQTNKRHIDRLKDGRWGASRTTPIYCKNCGELLPRPSIIDKKTGERRLISGFHSAYRRMEWDEPSRTLTRNFPFEASDNKIHPEQNRVLSVYEALVIQTIADYDYNWTIDGKHVTRSLIAASIGESVPPKLIEFIVKKFVSISDKSLVAKQCNLF